MSKEAVAELLSKGVLRCKREHLTEPLWVPAYKWMKTQMTKRIGRAPGRGFYPIWVWYQWEGKPGYQPISNFDYDRMRNQDFGIFRVDLEVPADKVLLSNWDTWSAPLCSSHLDVTDDEFDQLYWSNEQKIESWDRIFDIENIEYNRFYGPKSLSIQGCLWEITPDMVKKIQSFGPMKPTAKFLKHEKSLNAFKKAQKEAMKRTKQKKNRES